MVGDEQYVEKMVRVATLTRSIESSGYVARQRLRVDARVVQEAAVRHIGYGGAGRRVEVHAIRVRRVASRLQPRLWFEAV